MLQIYHLRCGTFCGKGQVNRNWREVWVPWSSPFFMTMELKVVQRHSRSASCKEKSEVLETLKTKVDCTVPVLAAQVNPPSSMTRPDCSPFTKWVPWSSPFFMTMELKVAQRHSRSASCKEKSEVLETLYI